MRLRLKLTAQTQNPLSINYQFQLSVALSCLFRLGNPQFLDYLKYLGVKIEGKKFKFFTFALKLDNAYAEKDKLIFKTPEAKLFFSAPLIDDYIKAFSNELIDKNLELDFGDEKFAFTINQIEFLPQPEFNTEMKFNLITPLVLTTKKNENPNRKTSYLTYMDHNTEFARALKGNLVKKCFLILGKTIENKELFFEWDRTFIKQRLDENKKPTTRTTLNILGTQLHLVGNKIPFCLRGNPELMKMGYECGFGEKNSMGFGMVKEILPDSIFKREAL